MLCHAHGPVHDMPVWQPLTHSATAVVARPRQGANIDLSLLCLRPPLLLLSLAAPAVSLWADTGCGRRTAWAGAQAQAQKIVSASGGATPCLCKPQHIAAAASTQLGQAAVSNHRTYDELAHEGSGQGVLAAQRLQPLLVVVGTPGGGLAPVLLQTAQVTAGQASAGYGSGLQMC